MSRKTVKNKGRSQSGRLSHTPDTTVCCFCWQKKRKMIPVQHPQGNRCYPACRECREANPGKWKYPR